MNWQDIMSKCTEAINSIPKEILYDELELTEEWKEILANALLIKLKEKKRKQRKLTKVSYEYIIN